LGIDVQNAETAVVCPAMQLCKDALLVMLRFTAMNDLALFCAGCRLGSTD
jgi:hypothetical protein